MLGSGSHPVKASTGPFQRVVGGGLLTHLWSLRQERGLWTVPGNAFLALKGDAGLPPSGIAEVV